MRAHYLPLGSHDTERVRTLCLGDPKKVRWMLLFQFCFPGAPAIYYGDEVGLEGGKDPDSRRAFPWDTRGWDQETYDWVRRLARLRKDLAPLRRGDFVPIPVPAAQGVYAFGRRLGEDALALVVNPSEATRTASIPVDSLGWPEGCDLVDVLKGTHRRVEQKLIRLRLAPLSGVLLRPST
jgi:neopullulanase